MSEPFDVVVVGSRCAGAPLATMLARAGLRVCVVDKDRFPSDTPSTHAIQPAGVQVLERIGVLDGLLKLAPPMVRAQMVFDDSVAVVDDVVAITGAPVLSVRRITLDEILVNAAAEAGAEVRTDTAVTGLVMDRGRVAGVTTAAGELRAPLVVGADGTRSAVAKMVGAKEYHPTANGRVFMWAYYEADPTNGEMWIGKIGDHAYLVTPTDNGLSLVAACPSIDRRNEVRADREAVYEAGVRGWPELHAGVAGSRREGPVHTMANMHGFFRTSAGPGWALVGDAGHFKDPTPGQGIADALRQSEKLAAAIERGARRRGGNARPDPARVVALARRGRLGDVLVSPRSGRGRPHAAAAAPGPAPHRRRPRADHRHGADVQPRSAPVAGLDAGVLADDDGAGAAARPRSAPGDHP